MKDTDLQTNDGLDLKNYLEKTNRPYSATDVFNNLNTKDNKLSKTAVSKALDDLSAKQLIKEKLNGKQKIYFADQNNFDGIDVNKIQIDQQLDQLTKQLKDIQIDVKHKESKLSSHKRCLTSEQLDQQLNQIKKEVNHLNNFFSIDRTDERAVPLSPTRRRYLSTILGSIDGQNPIQNQIKESLLKLSTHVSNNKELLFDFVCGEKTRCLCDNQTIILRHSTFALILRPIESEVLFNANLSSNLINILSSGKTLNTCLLVIT